MRGDANERHAHEIQKIRVRLGTTETLAAPMDARHREVFGMNLYKVTAWTSFGVRIGPINVLARSCRAIADRLDAVDPFRIGESIIRVTDPDLIYADEYTRQISNGARHEVAHEIAEKEAKNGRI